MPRRIGWSKPGDRAGLWRYRRERPALPAPRPGPAKGACGRRAGSSRRRAPRDADVALEEGLAGHAVARLELLLGQVLALLGLDVIGVLQSLLNPALAGAAEA